MKIGIKVETLWQPRPFSSERLAIEMAEVECTSESAEETVKTLFSKAKTLLMEQKNGNGTTYDNGVRK